MNRLFNLDNPFFVFMGRVADLFILNVVFVLCCIPIVTIGPALSAMFYVTMKMVKNEESYIIRSFFHSFKQNLKQGILIHLMVLAAGILLLLDFYITGHITASYTSVMRVLLIVISVFFYLEYLYVYPLLAKFDNTIKHTLQNAILMAIRHLPYTAIMAVISLSPFILLLIKDAAIQSVLLFVLILIGPTLIAYGNSFFFVKVFANYVPEEEPVEELDGSNPEFGIYDAVTATQAAPRDIFAELRAENAEVSATKEENKPEEE